MLLKDHSGQDTNVVKMIFNNFEHPKNCSLKYANWYNHTLNCLEAACWFYACFWTAQTFEESISNI